MAFTWIVLLINFFVTNAFTVIDLKQLKNSEADSQQIQGVRSAFLKTSFNETRILTWARGSSSLHICTIKDTLCKKLDIYEGNTRNKVETTTVHAAVSEKDILVCTAPSCQTNGSRPGCYLLEYHSHTRTYAKSVNGSLETTDLDCHLGSMTALLLHNKTAVIVIPATVLTTEGKIVKINLDDGSFLEARLEVDNLNGTQYTLASGNFDANPEPDFLVGCSRCGTYQTGMVFVFNQDLVLLRRIPGMQKGESFGSSIAVTDVNNDGRDDIVIGAPMYSPKEEESNLGRMCVYYQSSQHHLLVGRTPCYTTGTQMHQQFSFSLSTMSDMNRDGYRELVVGAPWGGPDQTGAIYLYTGGRLGLKSSPFRTIYPSDINMQFQWFSYSLSNSLDIKGNGIQGILVGTKESVVLLGFIPNVLLLDSTILQPNVPTLYPGDKSCTLDGFNISCVTLTICMKEEKVEDINKYNISIEYRLNIDTFLDDSRHKGYIRVNDSLDTVSSVTGVMSLSTCTNYTVFLKDSRVQFYRGIPILMDLTYDLDAKNIDVLPPLLANPLSRESLVQVDIQNDCENPAQCYPQIKLQISSSNGNPIKYVHGETTYLELSLEVQNSWEDAPSCYLLFSQPSAGVANVTITTEAPLLRCSHNRTASSCLIGNPFPGRTCASYKIKLQIADIPETICSSNMDFIVLSYEDEVGFNPLASINYTVDVVHISSIKIKSIPADPVYVYPPYEDPNVTRYVTHTYELQFGGFHTLTNISVIVWVPVVTSVSNDIALYEPQVTANGLPAKCEKNQPEYIGEEWETNILSEGAQESEVLHLECTKDSNVTCLKLTCDLHLTETEESIEVAVKTNVSLRKVDFDWKRVDISTGLEAKVTSDLPTGDVCKNITDTFPVAHTFKIWISHSEVASSSKMRQTISIVNILLIFIIVFLLIIIPLIVTIFVCEYKKRHHISPVFHLQLLRMENLN